MTQRREYRERRGGRAQAVGRAAGGERRGDGSGRVCKRRQPTCRPGAATRHTLCRRTPHVRARTANPGLSKIAISSRRGQCANTGRCAQSWERVESARRQGHRGELVVDIVNWRRRAYRARPQHCQPRIRPPPQVAWSSSSSWRGRGGVKLAHRGCHELGHEVVVRRRVRGRGPGVRHPLCCQPFRDTETSPDGVGGDVNSEH